jgi:hypothetical protein
MGATVIPFEYDEAKAFENGRVAVKKGRNWGYINAGNEIVEPFDSDEDPGMMSV